MSSVDSGINHSIQKNSPPFCRNSLDKMLNANTPVTTRVANRKSQFGCLQQIFLENERGYSSIHNQKADFVILSYIIHARSADHKRRWIMQPILHTPSVKMLGFYK